ncbi:C-terminal binding protein [Meredithblackwellia eburnea MCA 4105]
MVAAPQQVLNILELDGMHPDTIEEDAIFSAGPAHPYKVNFIRANLGPKGDGDEIQPISTLSDELCASIDGLLVFRHRLTKDQISRFTRLKVVVRCGVGYDRLDRVALADRGITVCNVPDYGTAEIADHAIALALSLRRGIALHQDLQRSSPPAPWSPVNSPLVQRITGSTFGVLGLGRIGTAAALRAKAFGMHIVFYDPYLPNGVDKSLGFERVRTVDELFKRSNILSIHCPHTTETRQMVSHRLLNLLPDDAVLINTARGEVVDTDAVEEALKSGKLAGAGLDVLAVEPIPEPAPRLIEAFRKKEKWLEGRLIVTPHSAYHSPASWADIRTNSAQTIRYNLIDGIKSNVISPESE